MKNTIVTNKKEEEKLEKELDKGIKVIQKKLKENLSYNQLRQIALEEINKKKLQETKYIDCLNFQNNVINLIDIKGIREDRNNDLKKKVAQIQGMSEEEKILKVLNDMNSSETFESVEKIIIKPVSNKEQSSSKVESIKASSSIDESTSAQSKTSSHIDVSTSSQSKSKNDVSTSSTNKGQSLSAEESTTDVSKSTSANTGVEIKHDFWIKHHYYDISEYSQEIKGLKRQILKENDKENVALIYENKLNTYYYAISQKLVEFYKVETTTPKSKEEISKENGLHFCGKKIEQYNKICRENEMMCKDCMKKNKEIYHLDSHKSILININGRVCTNSYSDRMFRCFGKFYVNKEIKNCIFGEFICKACQELNKQKKYYDAK